MSTVSEAAECGRWLAVAIATRKHIDHVFPVNPYGGKSDHRSQLEGRVGNIDELVSRQCSFLFFAADLPPLLLT
jgi:hypothetical protein